MNTLLTLIQLDEDVQRVAERGRRLIVGVPAFEREKSVCNLNAHIADVYTAR